MVVEFDGVSAFQIMLERLRDSFDHNKTKFQNNINEGFQLIPEEFQRILLKIPQQSIENH